MNRVQSSLNLRLSAEVCSLLVCPACQAVLRADGDVLNCTASRCEAAYPVRNGVLILIHEPESIFRISEILANAHAGSAPESASVLRRLAQKLIPGISLNLKAKENYANFAALVRATGGAPKVLVIGGGTMGEGMEPLFTGSPALEVVETDIYLGPRTNLVCDAHSLPFQEGSFDGVIAQAVLEHVVDPNRCAQELYRVLKPGGILYAETPFMQQVHGGRYDFTRFTHSGHRRLFRRFEEIQSGASCGPGMALAWSWNYFLVSFATSPLARKLLLNLARCTSFFWKYFDHFVIDNPASLDAACGVYFLGRKAQSELSDRELIKSYRGAL